MYIHYRHILFVIRYAIPAFIRYAIPAFIRYAIPAFIRVFAFDGQV